MNGKTSSQEWRAKEARELFCKAVNSMLMTTPEKPLKEVLKASKEIVDTAFKYFPVPFVIKEPTERTVNLGFTKFTKKDESK